MDLTPHVDVEKRCKEEINQLHLTNIKLEGNTTFVAVAQILLAKYAPHIKISDEGTQVTAMSMESFGARVLETFLEETNPPTYPILLVSIPEEELFAIAKKHNITIVEAQKNDTRVFLDNLSQKQPQTYFSIAKSAQRLKGAMERLRSIEEK